MNPYILPAAALWLRHRLIYFNLTALVLNVLAMAGTLGLLYLIATSWRLF